MECDYYKWHANKWFGILSNAFKIWTVLFFFPLLRCAFILGANGEPLPFSQSAQEEMVRTVIEPMASEGLRTIAIAYKNYVGSGMSLLPVLSIFAFYSTS